ncbi:hypothetical protein ACE6H2_013569 [Prunus campanulata]
MASSTPSLQGERGSEEKLSLLLLLPVPCIAVDDAYYVQALLPLLVPILLLLRVMVPILLLMPLPCLTLFF